ncbi:MAG: STAS domain-containing protein [Thiovulaceae bacterium]|nr:STAS domain-containing protein [Sulfurimonadaceae bacterium]
MRDVLHALQKIVREDRQLLIDDWVGYFSSEEHESEMRYYSDFLSFFDECIQSDLDPLSEEAIALSNFMRKVAEIRGEERFYNFKNSVYTCYIKFPLFKRLDERGIFHYEVASMMTAFFEALTSRLIFRVIQDNNRIQQASAAELSEREAPISEIWKGILLVSIVGTLDSNRVIQIIDKILETLEKLESEHVIIDINAIYDVNTEVANQLRKLYSAISMMGSHAYLTGISKNIAKAMTHLELSIGEVQTFRTTRKAVEFILKKEID